MFWIEVNRNPFWARHMGVAVTQILLGAFCLGVGFGEERQYPPAPVASSQANPTETHRLIRFGARLTNSDTGEFREWLDLSPENIALASTTYQSRMERDKAGKTMIIAGSAITGAGFIWYTVAITTLAQCGRTCDYKSSDVGEKILPPLGTMFVGGLGIGISLYLFFFENDQEKTMMRTFRRSKGNHVRAYFGPDIAGFRCEIPF